MRLPTLGPDESAHKLPGWLQPFQLERLSISLLVAIARCFGCQLGSRAATTTPANNGLDLGVAVAAAVVVWRLATAGASDTLGGRETVAWKENSAAVRVTRREPNRIRG